MAWGDVDQTVVREGIALLRRLRAGDRLDDLATGEGLQIGDLRQNLRKAGITRSELKRLRSPRTSEAAFERSIELLLKVQANGELTEASDPPRALAASRLPLTRKGRSRPISSRDEDMIRLRREGKTLQEIGSAYGITRARVGQVLRNRLGAKASTGIWRDLQAARKDGRHAEDARAQAQRGLARRSGERRPLSRPKWSDADLIEILVEAHTQAFPLTVVAYEELRRRRQVVGPTSQTFGHRFGNWTAACAAAGVESGQRTRPYGREWSDREIVEFVREFFAAEQGESFAAFGVWAKENGAPSSATVRMRFGSWSKAKRLAAEDLTKQ
jgi:hypothetical protein